MRSRRELVRAAIKVDGTGACWWWLRSPGYISYCAAYVRNDGDVYNYGINVNGTHSAVRPVVWVQPF